MEGMGGSSENWWFGVLGGLVIDEEVEEGRNVRLWSRFSPLCR